MRMEASTFLKGDSKVVARGVADDVEVGTADGREEGAVMLVSVELVSSLRKVEFVASASRGGVTAVGSGLFNWIRYAVMMVRSMKANVVVPASPRERNEPFVHLLVVASQLE